MDAPTAATTKRDAPMPAVRDFATQEPRRLIASEGKCVERGREQVLHHLNIAGQWVCCEDAGEPSTASLQPGFGEMWELMTRADVIFLEGMASERNAQ